MSKIDYLEKDINRFWDKVKLPEMIGVDACWEWQAGRNKDGYGKFKLGGSCVYAHRLSYRLTVGVIPEGLCVCHRCDNPACVNPSHFWVGTNLENMQDRSRKGRVPSHLGINNPSHRLNDEDIKQIRTLFKTGFYTQKEIGDLFGVDRSRINSIVRYRQWTHLP